MTVHHMQILNKEQLSLRWMSDDSSTASSEAEITTSNTPLKTKPCVSLSKKTKSICFAEENEYYEIDHVDDLDKEEIANTWYSKREYTCIRAAYTTTVRLMMSARNLTGSEDHCPRGLEYRTPEGSQKRQTNKWRAIEAVLDEQHRQRSEGLDDCELLSQVYTEVAVACGQEALERGLQDAEAVAKLACASKVSPTKSPRRLNSPCLMMSNAPARRRAVLEDLQQMLSGTQIEIRS